MALHMREQLLRAVLAHAQGEIEKHKVNGIYTTKIVEKGIPETMTSGAGRP